MHRAFPTEGPALDAEVQRKWPALQGKLPGVSVIKPLVGVDRNLLANLETFFWMNYPSDRFELLFCVSNADDPALMIVRTLMSKYPDIDARIFTGK